MRLLAFSHVSHGTHISARVAARSLQRLAALAMHHVQAPLIQVGEVALAAAEQIAPPSAGTRAGHHREMQPTVGPGLAPGGVRQTNGPPCNVAQHGQQVRHLYEAH